MLFRHAILYILTAFLLLSGCKEKQPTPPPAHTSNFVQVADSKIYYETTGNGEPILFLHGGFLDHRMWAQQVKALADSFLVITCDLRGHGNTIDGDSNYFMYDGLQVLLDTLHIPRTNVVGLSMGSVAAMEFALAKPAYVNKLVLTVPGINQWGPLSKEDSLLVRYTDLMWHAADTLRDTTLAAEYFIRAWFDGPHRTAVQTDTVQRKLALNMAVNTMKTHHLKNWPRMSDSATLPRLHRIEVPVMIILGEKDNHEIRIISDTIRSKIPQTQLTTVPEVAHMPNMEKPDFYTSLLKSFLKKK